MGNPLEQETLGSIVLEEWERSHWYGVNITPKIGFDERNNAVNT